VGARDVLLQVLYIEIVLSTSVPLHAYPELADFTQALRSTSQLPAPDSQVRRLCLCWTAFAVEASQKSGGAVIEPVLFDEMLHTASEHELRSMMRALYSHYQWVQSLLHLNCDELSQLYRLFFHLATDGALGIAAASLLATALSVEGITQLCWLRGEDLLAKLGASGDVLTLSRFVSGVLRLCGTTLSAHVPALLEHCAPAQALPRARQDPGRMVQGLPVPEDTWQPAVQQQLQLSIPSVDSVSTELRLVEPRAPTQPVLDERAQELHQLLQQTGLDDQLVSHNSAVTPADLETLLDALSVRRIPDSPMDLGAVTSPEKRTKTHQAVLPRSIRTVPHRKHMEAVSPHTRKCVDSWL